MNAEKRENNEESASSDVDGGGDSSADGTNAAATIPKKRGRPAKANKVEKVPSGRGRGRPAKLAVAGDGGSEDSAVENGSKRPTGNGRGRPKGSKAKDASPKKSGKGRGRPKSVKRANDDEDDGEDEILPKKVKIGGKRPGRPRKSHGSDDEASDEEKNSDEEERVGRPTGGLNIARTGRGQGRPKKVDAVKKVSSDGTPKKRGRPPTNKGRARPKAASSGDEENDDDSKDIGDDSKADESIEEVDDDYISPGKKHRELADDELAAA